MQTPTPTNPASTHSADTGCPPAGPSPTCKTRQRILCGWLIATCIASVYTRAGETEGSKRSVAEESLVLLKQRAPYQPAVSQQPVEKKDSGAEVIRLERIVVTDDRTQREFNKMMESESQRRKNEQFSMLKGGAIYKTDRMETGLWKNQDMFESDANYKDNTPMVKIDLLHLKF